MQNSRCLGAILLAFWACVICFTTLASSRVAATDVDKEYILVTFSNNAAAVQRRVGSSLKIYSNSGYRRSAAVRYLKSQIAKDYPLQVIEDWPIHVLNIDCVVYEVLQNDSEALLTALAKDSRIESVQRMQYFQLQAVDIQNQYNDPYFNLQKGWHESMSWQTHRISTGVNVDVAVIDTAVDVSHPDINSAVKNSKRFVNPKLSSMGDPHGTAVAGVIAAKPDNRIGIVGVAPGVNIHALEACWRTAAGNSCNSFTLAKALSWAIERDIDIINLSLAGPEDALLHRLIRVAVDKDTVVIAASSDRPSLSFPASVDGVVAVKMAENVNKNTAGPEKKYIYAPGENIVTTVPGPSYDFISGSSLAAAHVSGIVALLMAYQPALNANQIQEQLLTKIRHVKHKHAAYHVVDACAVLVGGRDHPKSSRMQECESQGYVSNRAE